MINQFILKKYAAKDAFVSGKVEHVMTHEYGHLLLKNASKTTIKKIENVWKNTSKEEIIKEISNYAGVNYREMFAEAFVQNRIRKTTALSKRILRLAGVIK